MCSFQAGTLLALGGLTRGRQLRASFLFGEVAKTDAEPKPLENGQSEQAVSNRHPRFRSGSSPERPHRSLLTSASWQVTLLFEKNTDRQNGPYRQVVPIDHPRPPTGPSRHIPTGAAGGLWSQLNIRAGVPPHRRVRTVPARRSYATHRTL